MPLYEVKVERRPEFRSRIYEVMAADSMEARDKAEEEAANDDWSGGDYSARYQSMEPVELEDGGDSEE